jgi:hypothetical protein
MVDKVYCYISQNIKMLKILNRLKYKIFTVIVEFLYALIWYNNIKAYNSRINHIYDCYVILIMLF